MSNDELKEIADQIEKFDARLSETLKHALSFVQRQEAARNRYNKFWESKDLTKLQKIANHEI